MPTLSRNRIRLACDAYKFDGPLDKIRSITPTLWRGADVQFELAVLNNGVLMSVANLSSISLEVRPTPGNSGEAPDPATPCALALTFSSLDDTVTQQTWDDGTKQHVLMAFTNAMTNIAKGNYWLTVYCTTNDTTPRLITLAAGPLRVLEDGGGPSTTPPVPPEQYYTAAFIDGNFHTVGAADARFLRKNENLADLHDTEIARGNLGLGTAAVLNAPESGDAAGDEVVRGDDTRLTDARTPTTHTHPQSAVTNLVSDLAAKAPLASPALTGTPTAPTPSADDSSTKLATTAHTRSIALTLAEQNQVARMLDEAVVLNDMGSPTFTRATAAYDPATGVNASSGVRRRRKFPVGAGRFVNADLIERASTNLLVQSQTLGTTWTAADLTVGANDEIAPDNDLTADKLTVNSTPTLPLLHQEITITAGRYVSFSCYVKIPASSAVPFVRLRVSSDTGANGFDVWFNTSTMAVATTAALGTGSHKQSRVQAVALGRGWYRIWASGKVAAAATAVNCSIALVAADNSVTPATVGQYIWAWGAQAEDSGGTSFWHPTSYIATVGSTVTRNADVLSWSTPAELAAGGASRQAGTVLSFIRPLCWTYTGDHVIPFTFGSLGAYLMQDNASSSESATHLQGFVSDATDNNGNHAYAINLWTGVVAQQLALAWQAGFVATYINGAQNPGGGSPTTSTNAYFTAKTTLSIGQNAGTTRWIDGWVANLYWPRCLTAAELALLAKAVNVTNGA